MSELYLVVASGPDAGARVLVGVAPCSVGRAKESDLRLTDMAVSRKHLEVSLVGDRLAFRTCDGASRAQMDGSARAEGELGVGESVRVGNTVLVVTQRQQPEIVESLPAEHTDVSTLIGRPAEDLLGVRAVYDLVEALDATQDRLGLERAAAAWAAKTVSAVEARLYTRADLGVDQDVDAVLSQTGALVERVSKDRSSMLVIVPAHGSTPAALAFRLTLAHARPGAELRRLLVVAGRVIGFGLARIQAMHAMEVDNDALRRLAIGSMRAFLGSSPAAEAVARMVPRVAASDATLLLLGETGVGKTLVARLIHEAGPRAQASFRVINCATIPDNLLESELFGHERGAFTGAVSSRPGAFEAVGRGTLLLDEIGELPLASQAKLLRALEEKRFERVGSNRSIPLEARILAATNRDLGAMVAAGQFRSDLLFRVSIVNIRIAPLRERGDDVVLLAQHILSDLLPSAGRRVAGFSPAALDTLRRHPWPGNVRELRNAIEHALVVGDEATIEPSDFPDAVRAAAQPTGAFGSHQSRDRSVELPQDLAWLEQAAIDAALDVTGGNRTRAAALLGIDRVTLYRKLRERSED